MSVSSSHALSSAPRLSVELGLESVELNRVAKHGAQRASRCSLSVSLRGQLVLRSRDRVRARVRALHPGDAADWARGNCAACLVHFPAKLAIMRSCVCCAVPPLISSGPETRLLRLRRSPAPSATSFGGHPEALLPHDDFNSLRNERARQTGVAHPLVSLSHCLNICLSAFPALDRFRQVTMHTLECHRY